MKRCLCLLTSATAGTHRRGTLRNGLPAPSSAERLKQPPPGSITDKERGRKIICRLRKRRKESLAQESQASGFCLCIEARRRFAYRFETACVEVSDAIKWGGGWVLSIN